MRTLFTSTLVVLALVLGGNALHTATAQEVTTSITQNDDMETVLRGPLHEAFAEPIQNDPEAGLVVPKKPPELIEEIPPEARPADATSVWIPGYWGWDVEREDYFWISGVWRVPPPDRRWVPGYWHEVEDGFQWVSGMWAPAVAQQIDYLPYPPESLEQGPNVEAPGPDYYWVSGCWMYRDNRFVWRPGYWTMSRRGWVWLPSHYVWTPRGAVFVDGYWDYMLGSRGCVFAPVYFHRPVYLRPGYRYTPNVTVHLGRLVLSLFVQPRYGHYCWGDYYGPRYQQWGILPWVDFGSRRYDPLFAYNRAYYRQQGIDFDVRLRGWHDYFAGNDDRRPPRTLQAQTTLAARVDLDPQARQSLLGVTVRDALAGREAAAVELRRVNPETRQALARATDQMREVVRERTKAESARLASRVVIRDRGDTVVDAPRTDAKLKLPATPLLTAPRSSDLPPSRQPPLVRNQEDPRRPDRKADRDVVRPETPDVRVPDRGPPDRGSVDPEPRTDVERRRPRTERPVPQDTNRADRDDRPLPKESPESPRPDLKLDRRDRPDPGRDFQTGERGTFNRDSIRDVPKSETQMEKPGGQTANPAPIRPSPETRDSRPLTPPTDNSKSGGRELKPRETPRVETGERPRGRSADAAPIRPTPETRDSRPLTPPTDNSRSGGRELTPRDTPRPEIGERPRGRSADAAPIRPTPETRDSRPLTTPRETPRTEPLSQPRSPRVIETPRAEPRTESRDSRPITTREPPRSDPTPRFDPPRRTEPTVEPRVTPRETPRPDPPRTENRTPPSTESGRRERRKDDDSQ